LENVKIGLSDLKRRHCEAQYGHPVSTGKKRTKSSAKKRVRRKECEE
jgi:hypothetical protein